ncbi:MAG: GH116 family glycosyl-hydrolase [Anaerolineae bacterium]
MEKDRFVYRGRRIGEISFPLGGIGTGCIGLAGNGRLVDWEIFNHPNKGSVNGFSHFAIKAERDDEVLDARVLNGDLRPPYIGSLSRARFQSFGFGPPREYLTGVPHFRDVVFRGQFPIAELSFVDDTFPGQVTMTAFNPFIPLNDRDSGIPAAFFEIAVENSTDAYLTYTIAGTLNNPLPANNVNRYGRTYRNHWIHLSSDGLDPDDLDYGTLTLATGALSDEACDEDAACGEHATISPDDVSYQEYWFRGRWFDDLEVYWRDFTAPGTLTNRRYPPEEAGEDNPATLAVRVHVPPGETGRVRFVIAWHFPNRSNDWNPDAAACACQKDIANRWRNYYAFLFKDSEASARYALAYWDCLYERTRNFQAALFGSDLPPAALDAVSANLSVLKSPTVMRLEDGTFYGFEGCHPNAGCCEGSCTHVWNYAQALPFLFPALERSVRDADYAYNQRPDGGMPFRLQLPLGIGPASFRPCADGQFGDVMKAYRDWKISGDSEWLASLWPSIKRSIEFAWSDENKDRWDPEKTGVLWGRQHHTLDMELFGPNAWLTGFYLGALKAGAEMADHLEDVETAAEYSEIYERGKAWVDEHLFNGSYYHQMVDLDDKAVLEPYAGGEGSMVGHTLASYWDEEHGELKYQIGEGCGIDQVLAQWHANLYGLGDLFDPEQVRRALSAIFAHNFKDPLRDHFNPCRVFGLNDEAGLVICDWPEGRRKPVIPVPYAQEAMHGFEYAAAIQMIQSGLVDEGMAVVRAVRDRYDGERRNPWNEFECGSNYARSMASYALLNAFSGFTFDMAAGRVGFDPIMSEDGTFRCFWSLDAGWGTVSVTPERVEVLVIEGTLRLNALDLPFVEAGEIMDVSLCGDAPACDRIEGGLVFSAPICVDDGSRLIVHRGN